MFYKSVRLVLSICLFHCYLFVLDADLMVRNRTWSIYNSKRKFGFRYMQTLPNAANCWGFMG